MTSFNLNNQIIFKTKKRVMLYRISLLKERAQYVIDEFQYSPSKVKVLPHEEGSYSNPNLEFIRLEINIENSSDALTLFHAGTAVGRDAV